jgi:hypothetical protein
MIMFTNERCISAPRSAARGSLPFNPGELYLVRYMALPTVVTVLSIKDGMVTTWNATETQEQFNARVICKVGERSRVFGFFLPWAHVSPARHVHLDTSDALGASDKFWNVARV